MSVTILYTDEPATVDAREDGERLWIAPEDLAAATGWEAKPEGLCRGEACVPLPADGSWQDGDGRIDLASFATHLRQPVVHDADHSTWAFGSSVSERRDALLGARAPDFELPDLDGNRHRLSDHLGRKVFLFTYGSY